MQFLEDENGRAFRERQLRQRPFYKLELLLAHIGEQHVICSASIEKTYNSARRQNFKNHHSNFFCINMRSLYMQNISSLALKLREKFQLMDGQTTCHSPMAKVYHCKISKLLK